MQIASNSNGSVRSRGRPYPSLPPSLSLSLYSSLSLSLSSSLSLFLSKARSVQLPFLFISRHFTRLSLSQCRALRCALGRQCDAPKARRAGMDPGSCVARLLVLLVNLLGAVGSLRGQALRDQPPPAAPSHS